MRQHFSEELLKHWLQRCEWLPTTAPVAVGWSGGADSTALLLALQSAGMHVEAWHVDHAWRDASAAEADALAAQAAMWNIPFISHRLAKSGESNREATARDARYKQFEHWGEERGVQTLCLGHHADDQAETVCMRMLQGAGAAGCRGMRSRRQLGELTIVRPLLHVPGGELRTALIDVDINWLEDPSNHDTTIRRNHLRRRLFPAINRAGFDAQQLFLRWQKQAEVVAGMLDLAVNDESFRLQKDHQGGMAISWSAWRQSQPAIRARLLQKCMASLLGEGVTPGRRHIEMVEHWTRNSGRGGLDLSRCRLYRERELLCLKLAGAAIAYNR